MKIKLKPCPFCRAKAKLHTFHHTTELTTYVVICVKCEARSARNSDKNFVINAWNTRAESLAGKSANPAAHKPGEPPMLGAISKQNNAEFAQQITFFKMGVRIVDWDYADRLIDELRELADGQETMLFAKPDHPQEKIDAIRAQADALEYFFNGVKKLKEAGELKLKAEKSVKAFKEIQDLFF